MSNKKNILVTGANGQLGMEFRTIAELYPAFNFLFVSKEELSINNSIALERYFSENKIDHCINCAAYTAVDKAETEKEIAFEINGYAVGRLAVICKKYQVQFIHFSTDYVFNGKASVPYKETDTTDPVNTYGASKLLGESEALKSNPGAVIFRTSWVYSRFGKNFVKTILRLLQEKEQLSVVNDQMGSPTYANDLARATMKIIEQENATSGIFNYCNSGAISWYEFSLAIKELSKSTCKIIPVSSSEFPTPAKRPQFSVLDNSKFQKKFNVVIPFWKESLQHCMHLLNEKLLP